MSEEPVPRLDLAPRRKRPLALWNPLDYLVLLYWVFFFPQAIRWYLARFGDPEHQGAKGGRAVWQAVRGDPIHSELAVQALGSLATGGFGISFALQAAGVPVPSVIVAFCIALSVVAIGSEGVGRGVAVGIAGGVALGVAGGVAVGVAAGVAGDVPFGAAFGAVRGAIFGTAGGLVFGIALNVSFGVAGGIVFGVARSVPLVFFLGATFSVALGVAGGTAAGVAFGVTFGVTTFFFAPRTLEWLVLASFGQIRCQRWWSRMVWIPLPELQRQIESWLERSWVDGLTNAREVLAYSLQFIPVVGAVNGTLSRSPSSRLLLRVAELVRDPFDWKLVRFCSEDLHQSLRRAVFDGFVLVPQKWRGKLRSKYPAELRIDTPAHAACAGFWYWHQEDAESAVTAFEKVRNVQHGAELHRVARAITDFDRAASLEDLAELGAGSSDLESLPDPELRPGALKALRTLSSAAAEAAIARSSRAPLNRSTALGRATAGIDRLIEEGAGFCPEPEWPLIEKVAEKWRRIVARAGGAEGEEVLREPVPNPYEGYSGLPVTGPTFVGRRTSMHQIETRWATGDLLPVLILYGHRRMGKTSILCNLEQAAPIGTLLVYLDMQNAGLIDHTGQLLLDLAEAVHKRAAAADLDAGPPPAEADYATLGTARRALNALLERLDATIGDHRLILAVDEFELIEDGIRKGRIEADVLEYLRSLNQRHRWLALIFGGLHTLDEMGRDYQSAFYGQTEHIRVGYLDRDDALRLVTQPHPDFALEYADDLIDELYRLTFGQPYLTQLLCWELVTRWNERFLDQSESTPRTLELADLDPVINADLFARAEYYFDGVWSNVSEKERVLMRVLARREKGWAEAGLVAASGRPAADVASTLKLLHRHDVTVKEEGRIRYASELLRRWVFEREGHG